LRLPGSSGDKVDALTSPAPRAPKPGVIVLARHGEPAISRKVRLTAQGYRDFWASYEERGLMPGQTPPAELRERAQGAHVLITSIRPRAVESAQALAPGREFPRDASLIEAPLPPPRLPGFLRLSPKIWGFLARVWWWYFNHHENEESRAQAEARADAVAARLEAIAEGGEDVVVVAHGFFNLMIGRALVKRGWAMFKSPGWTYWSVRRFERK
jgi:broad specificity phosphatase PhoE